MYDLVVDIGSIDLSKAITSISGMFFPEIDKEDKRKFSELKGIPGWNILFGDDPYSCGIVRGDTNIRQYQNMIYSKSTYIYGALKNSGKILKTLLNKKEVDEINVNDSRASIYEYKNLLVLGGPVANNLTKDICGYKDIEIGDGKTIPIFQENSKLRWGFYLGNENGWGYWGDNKRTFARLNTDGKIEPEHPLYGIIGKHEKPIAPIIEDERLDLDMLMVVRIPNFLRPKLNGTITIIGGMHGSALEAFFNLDSIGSNITMLNDSIGINQYFQMLVPAKRNVFTHNSKYDFKMDWEGCPNWRPRFYALNEKDFRIDDNPAI